MKWRIVILSFFIPLSAFAQVRAYFNHNRAQSYTEPYRHITRPGDDLEQVIVEQIYSAKKSVFIAVQELRLPKVALALVEKFSSGVDVRVILEHDYNFNVLAQRDIEGDEYEASKLNELKAFIDNNRNGLIEKSELESRDAIYILQSAGVPIMDDTFDLSMGSGLMHHKFMVVDGKRTIISTANFTMSCVHGDTLSSASRGNANSMVLVNSSDLADIFSQEFFQMWGNGKRGNFGHNKTYRGAQTVDVKGTKFTIQFSPTSRRLHWNESVNGLIAQTLNTAQESVKSALYVFSDQSLANVLENVHERGGEIGVLIEPKFAYRNYSELLDMLGIEMLGQNCRVEPDNRPWKNPATEVGMVIMPKGDVLHHKFAVVDKKTTIIGSQNWSDAANYVNDETLVVIEDKSISDSYTQEYERLKSISVLGVTPRLRNEIEVRERACAESWYP